MSNNESIKKVAKYRAKGVSGLNAWGNFVYEEFLPELRWPQAGRVYQEMADNDPVIGSILYLAETLMRGTSWSVVAASESKDDKDKAKFVEECMHDMDISWPAFISEVLSMFTYGFSFHETIYKIRRGPLETSKKYNSKYSDGKIGWQSLPLRSQRSLYGWVFNDEGNATAFIQHAPNDGIERIIPLSKGLLFRTRVSRNNPEGKSLLRNAYRPWYFKKHMEEIEGIGVERDLAGFPVLKLPQDINLYGADADADTIQLRNTAEELVTSVRRDAEEGLVLPYGWDLQLLTSGSSRQIDISNIIERYDNRIAITLLSDIVLLGQKSGSFALADNKQSTLVSSIEAQLSNISDVMNTQAIPALLKVNNMLDGETPKIQPGKVKQPSISEVALVLRAMNLNIADDKRLLNHIRMLLGFPEMTDDEFDKIYKTQANETTTEIIEESIQTPRDKAEKAFEQNNSYYETGGK